LNKDKEDDPHDDCLEWLNELSKKKGTQDEDTQKNIPSKKEG
jgi:hypothetical protein